MRVSKKSCRYCGGKGIQICPSCHGTGYREEVNPNFIAILGMPVSQTVTCRTCNGVGKQECLYCKGTGEE